ncbi:hypothetical protein L7F22_000894 [Adiantum nelumboides]|nr:hypothetical protein [Adiantum nelumboides]
MKSAAALLLFVVAAASPALFFNAGADDIYSNPTVVNLTCDPRGMIPQGSAFWGHLGFLLQQLADNAPYTPSLSFKTRVGGGDAPAFGEAACHASCPPAKCLACLRQLSSDIWRICNSAVGARVDYPDCWIHYECFYFS